MNSQSLTENISSLFIKDIDRIDSAIWEPTVGIKGQSWHVDITISGGLDENGFIFDFGLVKSTIKSTLKNSLDHALIVPANAQELKIEEFDKRIRIVDNKLSFEGPKQSVYKLNYSKILTKHIEHELNRVFFDQMPDRVTKVETRLRQETPTNGEFFHYTHGITGHQGHCQRLFHGHRSLIEIRLNEQRRPDIEKVFAESFLKRSTHIVEETQILRTENDIVYMQYKGTEGVFKGSIPQSQTITVKNGTSIEILVEFFASKLEKYASKGDLLEVAGYEGIGKGAISRRVIE